MQSIQLNNGVTMPIIGFGTYQITDPQECETAVLNAIDAGYRLIDTAQAYGNEVAVGNALAKSPVRRDELFITTKLWFQDYETTAAEEKLNESLKNLQTDYLDLVLLHWPFGNTYAAYRVLEKFYQAGKIKAIGVSNYAESQLIDLIHFNEIVPAVNQVETNLYSQQLAANQLMKKYQVAHQGYAPFGQNLENSMFDEPALIEIAEKYQKSPRQVVLRYFIQLGISVLPKSTHKERMAENIAIFDFSLTENEITLIASLDKNRPLIGNPQDPEKVTAAMTW
ncbi:aldo/keto reductase [Enterococcus sp. HY326]|uniref:aldo/keto reductase n=1 Tax=Enterococcus sp. HY326 TaxID=2971265 RepID=UPI00223F9FA9|nr:aldo/keto reductase [Enterococcus sp. HY326]